MSIVVRKSADRGSANHGWLDTHHTFSFAGYYDPRFVGFNSLRVINEDRVAPGKGFGTHPHSEMEIFSYVISGELAHKDSMGNRETIKRGDVQFTSAGTGILHSEFNGSNSDWVHFLQIWVKPNVSGIEPSYQTKHFAEEEKKDKLRLIVSPDGSDGSVSIHQDLKMYASVLQKGASVSFTWPAGRAGYIHLTDTKGSLSLNDEVILHEGDGAFINGNDHVTISISGLAEKSEFVLFDMKHTA
eukprot:Phypoly_transcript_14477.p1 GENE.Phypoly_transcript_14477~~Phypoly_transcript_14477.p1  ORF type:complete len:243 (+),score=38.68 Phypoly_transcript_14477:127-855(+)